MTTDKLYRACFLAGICLCISGMATGGGLDRLFLTPEQRLSMEALRSQQTPVSSIPTLGGKTFPAPVLPVTAPNNYFLNGLVSSKGGGYTVWLNGVSYTRANLPANVKIIKTPSSGIVSVTVQEKNKAYLLRPGQRLDTTAGRVNEPYQTGPQAPVEGVSVTSPGP